jgi:hypothetical protein
VVTGKRVVYSEEERGNVFEPTFTDVPGMTLRDYFAAHLDDDIDGGDFADSIKAALLGRAVPHYADDPVAFLRFEADFRAAWRGMRSPRARRAPWQDIRGDAGAGRERLERSVCGGEGVGLNSLIYVIRRHTERA